MAENSKIEWTDHTFNPWIGCTKVAPGCVNCYAEADFDKRRHVAQWGPNGTRIKTSSGNWAKPLKWNEDAKDWPDVCVQCRRRLNGTLQRAAKRGCESCGGIEFVASRPRVFCASLADVFEDWNGPVLNNNGQRMYVDSRDHSGVRLRAVGDLIGDEEVEGSMATRWATLDDVRRNLFALIDATPHLDWLLLTKRPENVRRMWEPWPLHSTRKNVWLGTSISDQATANKSIPELLKCRELSPVLFLSAEPLLGPIEFANEGLIEKCGDHPDMIGYMMGPDDGVSVLSKTAAEAFGKSGIGWVIVGGESGHEARPCHLEHVWSVVVQCKQAGVPVLVKQLGGFCVAENINNFEFPEQIKDEPWGDFAASCRVMLKHTKGGDWDEWPEDLRVRQYPCAEKAVTQ